MKSIKIFLCIIFVLLVTGVVFAKEESPIMLMDFYNLDVKLPDGTEVFENELFEGYPIPVGTVVQTLEGGYAEIELYDSTIIKIDEKTAFKIEKVMGPGKGDKNVFSLATGKFRAVVSSIAGSENYQFNGYASVCGVRGTDLGMQVDPLNNIDTCFVLDGEVNFTNTKSGKSIQLKKDFMANGFDINFEPVTIPDDFRKLIDNNLKFKKLKPDKVKTADKDKDKDKDKDSDTGTGTDGDKGTDKDKETGEKSEIPDWLKELIGLEIGSITIGDETYAKAVLQPTINLKPLKLALYLPIIYRTNMFDPDDWYKPAGNNEWSFGTDQEEPIDMAGDFFSDLTLKIKYLQWGEQRDKFWIKVGNMEDFTIGHGLIMRDYANDADFPSVRRLGLNLGMDFGAGGFEFISNDISQVINDPRIIGGRGFFRPFGKFAIGLSAIVDLNPGSDLPEITTASLPSPDDIGNPMFMNLGIDLELPIVESDFLSIVPYADAAGMLPWFRTDGEGAYASIDAGPHFEALVPEDGDPFLRNFGFASGIFGNVAFIDYILDFRYFTGVFRPQFFDKGYDFKSSGYALQTANYILDPDNPEWDNVTMGIYLEGGYTMDKVFSLEIGYMIPMTLDSLDGFQFMEGEDTFHATFTLADKVIPVVNISGGISYNRTYLYKMIAQDTSPTGKKLSIFDEYTSLNGELVYAVNDYLDIAYIFATAPVRDPETGEVQYESDGITMKINYTMGIETRIHY